MFAAGTGVELLGTGVLGAGAGVTATGLGFGPGGGGGTGPGGSGGGGTIGSFGPGTGRYEKPTVSVQPVSRASGLARKLSMIVRPQILTAFVKPAGL